MYQNLIPELLKKLFNLQDRFSQRLLLAYESLAILFCLRPNMPALKFTGSFING
jgi:hypothetical protein